MDWSLLVVSALIMAIVIFNFYNLLISLIAISEEPMCGLLIFDWDELSWFGKLLSVLVFLFFLPSLILIMVAKCLKNLVSYIYINRLILILEGGIR